MAAEGAEPRELHARLGAALEAVWDRQREFNLAVAARDGSSLENREDWTTAYLLGLASELDEVLRSIRWKRHRVEGKPKPIDPHQLGLELADLTKYVLCLWQLWGYTPFDLVDFTDKKSELVEARFLSETRELRSGQPVLLFDLDGTILNFREGFWSWLRQHYPLLAHQPAKSMINDLELNIPWDRYRELKDEWERNGGYAELIPYHDSFALLRSAQEAGWFLMAYTARPLQGAMRVWLDTWDHFRRWELPLDQLNFGEEERLRRLCELREAGHPVVYLEDHPDLALRAARLGARTVVRRHPYNLHLEHHLEHCPSLGLTEEWPASIDDMVGQREPAHA